MKLLFSSDKDTYITDKIVNGERRISGSLGYASTMDIYKLYGTTEVDGIPQTELTRGLIHFDISKLKELYAAGEISINDPTFSCKLVLKDVYGGQPTPLDFKMVAYPLSASFDEGYGKDVVRYADEDVANFVSASIKGGAWLGQGCSLGAASPGPCDYFNDIESEVTVVGPEDVVFDVTAAVSATLAGVIPDQGFRISLTSTEENDSYSYFVKRFSTRHAYDVMRQPRLYVEAEDYIIDQANGLVPNKPGDVFLYNFDESGPAHIVSASQLITGSECLILELAPHFQASSSYFTGSQYLQKVGYYSASVTITDPTALSVISSKGYAKFTPYWKSLDLSVTYLTGSTIEVKKSTSQTPTYRKNFAVSCFGIPDSIEKNSSASVRVVFFEPSNTIHTTRYQVDDPSSFVFKSQYGVRDVLTSEMVVNFGESTRLSTDPAGSYFTLSGMSLISGRTYALDVKVFHPVGEPVIYKDVSNHFRVTG